MQIRRYASGRRGRTLVALHGSTSIPTLLVGYGNNYGFNYGGSV